MDLAYLHPLYEQTGSWASAYVDLSHGAGERPARGEPTARAMARELAAQGADEATCRAVRHAVDDLVHSADPYGRALFARSGEVVLDPPLARPPRDGGSAQWAPLPRVAPLLELAGEDPVCVVAYLDRRGADFELRGGPAGHEADAVPGWQWPVRRTGSADRSERRFQLRVENAWEHNAAEIADALAVCQEETRADLLILVGDDRERRAVQERLPRRLHDRVVETGTGSGGRLLDEEVDRARAEHVRRGARKDLDRFLAGRVPDARGRATAVEGVPALVEAAREHRIDELLIRPEGPDTRREVWIGQEPDRVAVRRTELTALGAPPAWQARADDALLRAAVEAGAPAVCVTPALPDASADTPSGGLGALLRGW
ncbi:MULTISPECIES: Vms1/Ankzf1 family peptidyl-tRNA hydrolase [unclassified Streptomyces]|uniref:baeRF2 domain-containing protein n=1 Tax=unclassified Streptomyces TaxID=2593676 RepID=UPI001F0476E5|nr:MULTISPECIES: Vms1/Ankzf1 family peptidyl-tRNA hydrolase [unclassified Streptomyces]MCH0563432.1 hypothetical protein [Streptomyces sp. MUM 2J]MCH0571460.1 hypothetical protein [Streptomyces sp. MUM 136J]